MNHSNSSNFRKTNNNNFNKSSGANSTSTAAGNNGYNSNKYNNKGVGGYSNSNYKNSNKSNPNRSGSNNNNSSNAAADASSSDTSPRGKVLEISREVQSTGLTKVIMKLSVLNTSNPLLSSEDIRIIVDNGTDNIKIASEVMAGDEVKLNLLGPHIMEWNKITSTTDLSAAAAAKSIRKKRKVFNLSDLLGPSGLAKIAKNFPKYSWRGPLYESKDLHDLMKKYKDWAFALYPDFSFEHLIDRISTLGKEKRVALLMNDLRAGEKIDWNHLDLDKYEYKPADLDYEEDQLQQNNNNQPDIFQANFVENIQHPEKSNHAESRLPAAEDFPDLDEETELFLESKYNDQNNAHHANQDQFSTPEANQNNAINPDQHNSDLMDPPLNNPAAAPPAATQHSYIGDEDDFDMEAMAELDNILNSSQSNQQQELIERSEPQEHTMQEPEGNNQAKNLLHEATDHTREGTEKDSRQSPPASPSPLNTTNHVADELNTTNPNGEGVPA
jgi:hypothetical protein